MTGLSQLAESVRVVHDVLVVDDDAVLRASIAMLLTASGHRAREATDGRDALQMLTSMAVDVVITDLDMAGVTGWDVTRAAKQHLPPIPVIVLTGWGESIPMPPDITGGDVNAILPKPFPLDALLRLVADCTPAAGGM